jgi:hypothetical protein
MVRVSVGAMCSTAVGFVIEVLLGVREGARDVGADVGCALVVGVPSNVGGLASLLSIGSSDLIGMC